MRGYIIGALVARGVDRADARQLVERRIIEIPINVDTLSDEDIASLVALLKEEQGEKAEEQKAMPKEIKLSEIIPAGDGEIIPSDLPLFCFEFEGNLHLAPGQDKKLEILKKECRESYPIHLLPGSMGADQLVIMRDLFRAIYY